MVCQKVSHNLVIKEKNELDFPYTDMGFLYGYGLFETIRVHNKTPLLIREHCTRMRRGSIILDIEFSYSQDDMCHQAEKLIKENKITNGTLNIYLTPGNKEDNKKEKMLLMVLRPEDDTDVDKKLSIGFQQESFQRIPLDRFKTLSWYKNILERQLVHDVDDIVLFDKDKMVLEATTANIFFVKKNYLFTPKSSVILQGVTRQFLLNNQDKFGTEVIWQPIKLEEIDQFDEVFLTNSKKGIILVEKNREFPQLTSKEVSKAIKNTYQSLLNIQ
mgnify:CR=1 FL=1